MKTPIIVLRALECTLAQNEACGSLTAYCFDLNCSRKKTVNKTQLMCFTN